MRTVAPLVFLSAILCLLSCQKEITELPRPQASQSLPSLPGAIKTTYFDTASGSIDLLEYRVFREDTLRRTLTILDTVSRLSQTLHYNAAGQLIKLVEAEPGFVSETVFTRSGNRITWGDPVSPGLGIFAEITNLPNRRKEVSVRSLVMSFITQRITLGTDDRPEVTYDSVMAPNGLFTVVKNQHAYSPAGKIQGLLHTVHDETSQARDTAVIDFVKDDNNNEYWVNLLERIYGPDLLWANLARVGLPAFFEESLAVITDREFLSNGSVTSFTTIAYGQRVNQVTGSIQRVVYGPFVTANSIDYDSQGRITKLLQRENGKGYKLIEITYQ